MSADQHKTKDKATFVSAAAAAAAWEGVACAAACARRTRANADGVA